MARAGKDRRARAWQCVNGKQLMACEPPRKTREFTCPECNGTGEASDDWHNRF